MVAQRQYPGILVSLLVIVLCWPAAAQQDCGRDRQDISLAGGGLEEPPARTLSFWRTLRSFTLPERHNALIGFEIPGTALPEDIRQLREVESTWNAGGFDRSIEMLRRIEERRRPGGIALGISWRVPRKISGPAGFGTDVMVGTRGETDKAILDYHDGTGNLFVVTKRPATTGADAWNVFISTDGGGTWSETYQWLGIVTVATISAVVVDDYLYILYVTDASAMTARSRRCSATSGAYDSGYGYVNAISAAASIKRVAAASNADGADDRLYLMAILASNELLYTATDSLAATWNSPVTVSSNAETGLDLTYNKGFATNKLWACFIDTSGDIRAARKDGTVWPISTLPFAGTTPRIAAFRDNVAVAYEYDYAEGPGIQVATYTGTGWSLSNGSRNFLSVKSTFLI